MDDDWDDSPEIVSICYLEFSYIPVKSTVHYLMSKACVNNI